MTLAIRYIPNPGRRVLCTVSGRTYPVTVCWIANSPIDIPFADIPLP
jgi:hypothetical protein